MVHTKIGEIGFHGAVKLVDKKPMVAFILVDGGSEHMGSENFGKMAGNIVATKIPEFLESFGKYSKTNLQNQTLDMENDTQSAIHGTYKSI